MSEQSSGRGRRLPPAAIAAIVVAALCGIALYIRIDLPYERIFINDWIWFRETDAYYYLRHIENMVHNFPRFNAFDPYMLFPETDAGGGTGLLRPMFAWIVAGATRLFVGSSPTQYQIAAMSAFMPAVLGALTLIPVYFIGRTLFNRWAGVLAAALLAVMPGEFLHRSLLGFTDHHVAEALFSTTAVLFVIMAVKKARESEMSFAHLFARDWPVIRRPLVYTLFAGVFLGFYLLSWIGGLLFIFIIFAYLVIQFIVDHLRGRSTDYLCIIGTPLFLIAFLMLIPVLGGGSRELAYRVSLVVGIVMPVVLSVFSRLLSRRGMRPYYYPLVLLGLVGITLLALRALNPALLDFMLRQFVIFAPEGAALTVLEVHGLTLQIAWSNFTTSFFISFIALVMLAYVAVKERSAEKTVLLVWCVVMLAAVMGQRRFGYYFAVNVALLTGYFSWKMLDLAGLSKLLTRSREAMVPVPTLRKKKKTREKPRPRKTGAPAAAWAKVIVVAVAIFFIVFFPNLGSSRAMAGGPHFIGRWLADGWYESCLWLKENTPEPFGDPEFYYESYPAKADFEYPDTIYGVMSWWDYGYFITQIGRRVPNANPMQAGAVQAGQFFTALDQDSAGEVADARGVGYVMIDHMMATSKFYAMAEWAGKNPDDFYGVYYQPAQDGRLTPVMLYYPAYYRSTVVRLYNFDGKAVVPTQSIVIAYEDKVSREGISYKEITDDQSFHTYQEALDYIAGRQTGNYRIVSGSRFSSPVPLEELTDYELVYESEARVTIEDTTMPGVKVFRYLRH